MPLAEKLKERKVVQWVAAYFAVAWGLLEVLGFLANQFDWPGAIVRSATMILGSGIFIVLILSWHHGDKGRQRVGGLEALSLAIVIFAGGLLTAFINLPDTDSGPNSNVIGQSTGPVTRLTISLPRDQRLGISGAGSHSLAISPDGSRVAYVAETSEGTRLAIRSFDSFEATVLSATQGAEQPFFSPDGEWVGFFASGEMRKVPVRSGEPLTITSIVGSPSGASWGLDGNILYSLNTQGLWMISSSGGEPRELTTDEGPNATRRVSNSGQFGVAGAFEWPSILPDGKHAIVTDRLHAYLLSLTTGETRQLVSAAGRQARYLHPGYIIYTETGEKLRAVAFDLATQEITGQPFPVLENVFRAPGAGAVYFDVSGTGTLLYVIGGFQRSLVVADSDGTLVTITDDRRGFRFPRFSPDGDRVLVSVDPRPTNLWIYDIARGIGERLTSDGHNLAPLWHTGSNRIAYSHSATIRGMDPDRPDRTERIFPADGRISPPFYPSSSTADGSVIVGTRRITATQTDIHVLTTGDSPQLTAWLETDSAEQLAHIRADGKWISYASDETGRTEIYMQTFPDPGARTRVTAGGGTDPTWSRDGKRLFYRQGDRIMVVEISTEPTVVISEPVLFVRTELDTTQIRNWDVGPDDRVVLIESDPTTTREFQVVLNWSRAVQDMEK